MVLGISRARTSMMTAKLRRHKLRIQKRVVLRRVTRYKWISEPGDKYVSITTGIKIPQSIKNFMATLTPEEQLRKNRGNIEVATYHSIFFDKKTLRIITSDGPIDAASKRAIEYATRTNLQSLTPYNRQIVMKYWNGAMHVNVKKLVKTGGQYQYQLGWHRDALRLQVMGINYKGFCLGALYVNKPENITGGEIQFARNTARFGLAPPSGTSVTFLDDEVFHRVTPVQAPEGIEYVPRSAFFLIYLTDEKGPFKKSIVEQESGLKERNYSKFFRTIHPALTKLLNKKSPLTPKEKEKVNRNAVELFKRPNATHENLKALYTNMKRTLGHEIYQNANVKRLLNKKTPLTTEEKAKLNAYARNYFGRPGTKNSPPATHVNLKARYNNLKKIFSTQGGLGVRTTNNLVGLTRVSTRLGMSRKTVRGVRTAVRLGTLKVGSRGRKSVPVSRR